MYDYVGDNYLNKTIHITKALKIWIWLEKIHKSLGV